MHVGVWQELMTVDAAVFLICNISVGQVKQR